MDVLPQSIMLLIFSYLPYEFVQTIASLVCKAWHQLAYDKNLIKYAGRKDLSEINARDSLKETVDNFLQAVKWRPRMFHKPRMFHSIDLCGATTTWKTFGEIAHNCTELKILNMARTKGEILEYPLIQATNIVELNLSETLINDQLFVLISKSVPKLGILNVSRCYNLTNLAIEKSSFPSLHFLGIAYCMFSIEAIICVIDKHGIFAICVRGIKLQNEDVSHLIEFYPDVADIGIPTLCDLPEGTVSQEALPQLCPYCCSSSLATILSAKDANDASWMEL